MRQRGMMWAGALAIACAGVSLMSISVAGQARPAAAKTTVGPALAKTTRDAPLPRTPDGHPDLQGTYDVATITPIERPAAITRLVLSDQEAAALEHAEKNRTAQRALPSEPDRAAPPVGAPVGGYNNFWIDRGTQVITVDNQKRSSLIIDPPDGRIPPFTQEAQRRNASSRFRNGPNPDAAETAALTAGDPRAYDNPEQRPLGERCLLGFGSTSGPPTLPNYFYNNYKQIVQTPGYVMILNEMVHDARIVRMNAQHMPPTIRRWMGDSVGHWEGDALVVDTTNFTDKTRFRGSSENLHVTERFWRADANTVMYRFTVDDPTTWTRPWTGEYPWVATSDRLFEYACHEANYALGDILRGARALEAEAAAKSQTR